MGTPSHQLPPASPSTALSCFATADRPVHVHHLIRGEIHQDLGHGDGSKPPLYERAGHDSEPLNYE